MSKYYRPPRFRSNEKEKKSQFNLFFCLLLLTIILISITTTLSFFNYKFDDYGNEIFSAEHSDRIDFEINKEDNTETVCMKLENAGLIKKSRHFEQYMKKNNLSSQIKPGEYKLSAAMSTKKIAYLITRKKGQEKTLIIPQSITTKDIKNIFIENKICTEVEFWDAVHNSSFEGFSFLENKRNNKHKLEGYLFPGQYIYDTNMSVEDILTILLDSFLEHYNKIPEITSKLSTEDIVILASMLEREARSDGEKPAIASVYINRINAKMPLQCDATIVYAKKNHYGLLTYEDYKLKSPYNTYLHKGLPPTPICNPGMPSLIAAANPAKTEYYFYLYNTQVRNAHVFAKTYEEHLQNRKIYGYD